jgi:anaerobic C4-dicarboxylate transporter
MKRNEFVEIDNPKNKVNVFIFVIAVVAVIVTGVVYAIKLNDQSEKLNAMNKSVIEYYQNQEGNI